MSELKTNYMDVATRYELAERQVWANLPNWKKLAVSDYRNQEWESVKDERLLREFTNAVVNLAESSTALDKSLPAVPVTKQKTPAAVEPEPLANPS